MKCEKCSGKLIADLDGVACINCGWRPIRLRPLPLVTGREEARKPAMKRVGM